jgi:chromosome condensin MukBEF ATPase and DNA-binding subunit MukB
MTSEERIEQLEKEVAQLRCDLTEVIQIFSQEGGRARAFEQAVLALITATPPNALLDKVLPDLLARTEAHVVSEILMEPHLDGVQLAQELILEHLEKSHQLYAD